MNMSTNMAALLGALAAACMVGSICLLVTDIYIILQDRKEKKKETPDD